MSSDEPDSIEGNLLQYVDRKTNVVFVPWRGK